MSSIKVHCLLYVYDSAVSASIKSHKKLDVSNDNLLLIGEGGKCMEFVIYFQQPGVMI